MADLLAGSGSSSQRGGSCSSSVDGDVVDEFGVESSSLSSSSPGRFDDGPDCIVSGLTSPAGQAAGSPASLAIEVPEPDAATDDLADTQDVDVAARETLNKRLDECHLMSDAALVADANRGSSSPDETTKAAGPSESPASPVLDAGDETSLLAESRNKATADLETCHSPLSSPDIGAAGSSPAPVVAAPSNNKGKQKQKAVHFQAWPPTTDSTTSDDDDDDDAHHQHTGFEEDRTDALPIPSQAKTPPKQGDPGWEVSAGRAPAKLPIRFQDAVGRVYIFPWEKARTWKGLERMIRACFLHVNILGPHVLAGHYDLTAETGVTFEDPYSNVQNSTTSNPGQPSASNANSQGQPVTKVPTSNLVSTASTHAATSSSAPPAAGGPSTYPTAIGPPPLPTGPIILPELWEDLAVPGMYVRMQMWPMSPPIGSTPPPPPPLQPPIMGRGGFGRGTATMGHGPPPPPHLANNWVPPPPAIRPGMRVVGPSVKARPKTRRRTEGTAAKGWGFP